LYLISWVEFYIEEAAWGSRGATSDTSQGSGRDVEGGAEEAVSYSGMSA
jgi:hypothetical protein